MNLRDVILSFALLAGAAAAGAEPIAQPFLEGDEVQRETFGDDRNVGLLADLLTDDDPSVRAQAVRALGETRNQLAVDHIRRALGDEDVAVRCAAVTAATEFPGDLAEEIVLRGLRSPHGRVVLAALRSVRRLRMKSSPGLIRALLWRKDALLVSAALQTLTQLQLPARPDSIEELLRRGPAVIRLRAAENAVLLEQAGAIVDDLQRLAHEDDPAARAAALPALGRFAFDSQAVRALIGRAQGDPHAIVRRGALRAYAGAGRSQRIRYFLDDASPMVRLAAIKAAGDLKCLDCADRLMELMIQAPDDQSHYAARRSLRQIGEQPVADLAAAKLRDIYPHNKAAKGQEGPAGQQRKQRLIERNARACCWLLGEFGSKAAYDLQLSLLETLETDSPVLIDVAAALGKIGDTRAVGPLAKLLAECGRQGRAYMAAMMTMSMAVIPYSDEVTGAVIKALGRLGASGSVDTIIKTTSVRVSMMRLERPAAVAAAVLPSLTTAENRQAVEKFLLIVLDDDAFGLTAWFEASKAAGKLKMPRALPALNRILNEDRPQRIVMQAAAWSIGEITGRWPKVPNPKPARGDWIIRTLSE